MAQIKAIIADDEEQLRVYLRSRLSDLWPDLLICGEAGNGEDALALIEKSRPHIAFLDIRMPGISGMGSLKVRGNPWAYPRTISRFMPRCHLAQREMV